MSLNAQQSSSGQPVYTPSTNKHSGIGPTIVSQQSSPQDAALSPLATSASSSPVTVVVNFDSLQCGEYVGNYYAGGLGSLGSGPGPNYGITFTSNAQVQTDSKIPLPACASEIGGGQNTTNMPSPPNGMLFQSSTAATMNVPAGFTGGFSFYYASPFDSGFINVWSGLNGTGTLLATLNLPVNGGCQSIPQYCLWSPIGVTFSGTAQSVAFGGNTDAIVFDSITLGVALVVNPSKASGNPLNQPGSCSCGDPISIGTGNLFEHTADYATIGQNTLSFTRYYNTFAGETFAASLGLNWRSTYDRYLRILSASSVTAERSDGQQVNFNLTGNVWVPDSDVDIVLTNSGSTWTLTDSTDTTESYTVVGANQGLLHTIKARNGYTQTLSYNSSNQLTSVTDSYGRTLGFTDSNGLLQTVTTPDGLVLTYAFNSVSDESQLAKVSYSTTPTTSQTYLYESSALPFALTGIIDEDGNRYATWSYDSSGRGLSSQHAGGADLTTFSYNDTDGSRTVTNALGQQTVYKFSTLQGVPKVTEIDRSATSTTAAAKELFTYDANGYLASQTDWNGNLTTYVNDSHGQPTTVNEAGGTLQARTTTTTYDSTWVHLPDGIVTPGLTTSFVYDPNGNPLKKTLTDTTTGTVPYSTSGQTRTWTYAWTNSLLASAQRPRTDVKELTTYGYDSSGTLTSVTNALGQITKVTQHTPGGLPQTVVDPNGVTTNLTYDARLRLLSSTVTTAAGALTTKYVYDAAGDLISTTLPDGSALTNGYDAAHRLTGVTDLFKQSISYTLDALGDHTQTNVADATGKLQRKHSGSFDALGRMLQDIGGVGQTTVYTYDGNGNTLSDTDQLSHQTQQAFDALNRLIIATDPANHFTNTSYDAHDRPVSVTDPNGGTTTYTYDGFGDLIQQVNPTAGTIVYHYDPAGNLVQRVDARGVMANYTFDALDRAATTVYPGNAAEDITYTYDQTGHGFGIGRLTSLTDAAGTLSRSYDERGDVVSEKRVQGSVTMSTIYGYDSTQRIVSVGYPSGWTAVYTRDVMGRVTGVTTQVAGTPLKLVPVVSSIGYQPFGAPNAFTYGNGIVESRTFDTDYRETLVSDTGQSPFQKLAYAYDLANNVLSITDSVTGGNSQAFGYDALNRLTSASGGYGKLGYAYDAIGNRIADSSTAPSSALDSLGTINSLAYNQAGRVSAVTAGSQQVAGYSYDAFGQRLVRAGANAALYQYDLSGHLIEEATGQGNPQADYIYLGDQPIASVAPSTGRVYFLHVDRLGTPQVATDSNQTIMWNASYQPFGATSTGVGLIVQDLRLPGQEFDSVTNWNHNGSRDYIPAWGRYSQGDPIGLAGGLNRYVFVGNNPVNFRDPTGRWYLDIGLVQLDALFFSGSLAVQISPAGLQPVVGGNVNVVPGAGVELLTYNTGPPPSPSVSVGASAWGAYVIGADCGASLAAQSGSSIQPDCSIAAGLGYGASAGVTIVGPTLGQIVLGAFGGQPPLAQGSCSGQMPYDETCSTPVPTITKPAAQIGPQCR